MAAKGIFSSSFRFRLLILLLHITFSLAYWLKNCTILYQENPSADVSLDCAHQNLVTVPDDLPRNIVSLHLQNNLVKKIGRDDLLGMSKLTFLNVSHNKIASVDNGSFVDLVLLKILIMRQNNLNDLTSNIFQGLSNLTVLDLKYNKIRFIHRSAFQFLISLQTLDLGFSQLQQVSDILSILQLPQIQRINLECSHFSSFETKNLPLNFSSNLKTLDVSGYMMQKFSITTPIFPYLQMVELYLCGHYSNLKWDIPDNTLLRNITQLYLKQPVFSFKGIQNILQNLDSLKHLRLNFLTMWIRRGLLSNVCKIPTLRALDLFYTNLSMLTAQLAPCSQLVKIDLRGTHLKELPKGSIQSMTQLKFLNVSNNQLTRVPYDIRNLTSLKVLNMGHNHISKLRCEDFINTTQLKELHLNSNHVTKLCVSVFENLNNLKLLDLSKNLLLRFGDTFKATLQKLEVLDLSYNSIPDLETGDFQGLKSLKQLNVVLNNYKSVGKKTFYGLNHLQVLTVSLPVYKPNFSGLQNLDNLTIYIYGDSFNMLPNVEAAFHLKAMKSLSVICNNDHYSVHLDVPKEMLQAMIHLENFKAVNIYINAPKVDTFKFNTKLKSLTLTHDDLSDLQSELFLPIPNLEKLDLSKSELKSLDFLVQANLTALRYLKLTNNEITVINEAVLSSLHSLTYLDLSINPFTCECSNADFIQWIKSNEQTQVINAHQYKCSFPLDRRGTLLLENIMENITDAIYGSRKTICVISRHYLQSEWCSREIQMASFRLFDEQKDVLILLFLEEIPSRHLSPYYRMRKLVKKRTYLSWPQAAQHPGVFWQNVQRALQTGDALTENTDLLTGPAGPAGP